MHDYDTASSCLLIVHALVRTDWPTHEWLVSASAVPSPPPWYTTAIQPRYSSSRQHSAGASLPVRRSVAAVKWRAPKASEASAETERYGLRNRPAQAFWKTHGQRDGAWRVGLKPPVTNCASSKRNDPIRLGRATLHGAEGLRKLFVVGPKFGNVEVVLQPCTSVTGWRGHSVHPG